MFNIFKRRHPKTNDLSALKTDMHSHILPGIDDGSPDPETSLQLLSGLEELGYSKFITTPHILWDMYKNDRQTIGEAESLLQEELTAAERSFSIHPAAEYYMDEHFDELLASGAPLMTLKDNLVLVEFSFVSPPLDLNEKLFELQVRGYQPVIAHPERYLYFGENKRWYNTVRESGCYLQLNLLSLAGYYGRGPLELAKYIYKNKLVDLLGTDLHHDRHLHALRTAPGLMDHVKEILDSGRVLNSEL